MRAPAQVPPPGGGKSLLLAAAHKDQRQRHVVQAGPPRQPVTGAGQAGIPVMDAVSPAVEKKLFLELNALPERPP